MLKRTIVCLFPALLVGCTGMNYGIGGQAEQGQADALLQAIRSGAIAPNEYVQSVNEFQILPICAVAGRLQTSAQVAAFRELMVRKARADIDCMPDAPGALYPLDLVVNAYAMVTHHNLGPRMAADLTEQADALIAAGAKSRHGEVHSRADFLRFAGATEREYVVNTELLKKIEQEREDEERVKRERERRDAGSGNTLAALATIAGMAANNYANIKAQERATSLPSVIAKVDTFPAPNSQSSSSAATSRSNNATRAPQAARPAAAPTSPPSRQAAQSDATPAQLVATAVQTGAVDRSAAQADGGQARTNAARQGTLYFKVFAYLNHSRNGNGKYLVEENLIPVAWTWPNPIDSDRTWHIASEARPKVMEVFRAHMESRYPPCTGKATPDGCWGLQLHSEYGTSPEDVYSKVEQRLRNISQVERQNEFTYQTQVVYRPAQ